MSTPLAEHQERLVNSLESHRINERVEAMD